MTTFEEEESFGLTSTFPYADKPRSHSGSPISSSEPLLEDRHSRIQDLRRSKWRKVFFPTLVGRSTLDGIDDEMRPGRRKGSRLCLRYGVVMLLLLGVIQLLSLIANFGIRALPNGIHRRVETWGLPGRIGAGLASWPTDFSRDILPIPCHSHNDYWRTVPLYSAIEVGCIGVEADIWLSDEQLYVGHSVASLTPNRTINSLYINPLLDILAKQNPKNTLVPEPPSTPLHGVFDTVPEQSLILLIDFKTAGDALWPYVQSVLEPLRVRNYLTRSNGTNIISGAITVVGTGNTPFDLVNSDVSNPHHDIFFDAPLNDLFEEAKDGNPTTVTVSDDRLPLEAQQDKRSYSDRSSWERDGLAMGLRQKQSDREGQGKSGMTGNGPDVFSRENSYYASVAFGKAFGELRDGQFSEHQMDLLRGQIRGAHKRGLKARYWDLPFWPIGLRNHVWDVLVKEGVDMLNVDDLKGATKRNWDSDHGWWKLRKGESNDV